MKTAEEFAVYLDAFGKGQWLDRKTIKQITKEIKERDKQIQLDAFKAGERFAAGIVEQRRNCYAKVESGWHYSDLDRKAILTDANNRQSLPNK